MEDKIIIGKLSWTHHPSLLKIQNTIKKSPTLRAKSNNCFRPYTITTKRKGENGIPKEDPSSMRTSYLNYLQQELMP